MTQQNNPDNINSFDKKYLEEQVGINRSNLNLFLKAIGLNQSTFSKEEVERVLELRELKEKEGLTLKEMTERFGNPEPENKPQNHNNQQQQYQSEEQYEQEVMIEAHENMTQVVDQVMTTGIYKITNDFIESVPTKTFESFNIIYHNQNGRNRLRNVLERNVYEQLILPKRRIDKTQNRYELGMSLSDVEQKIIDVEQKRLEAAEDSQQDSYLDEAE